MSAVDPWCYDEDKLLACHQRVAEETNTPGEYLPMRGAMPEKFNAPQGNLYHDIRPQGFAMGAWLAGWSSLGLRRLPYGYALRPTRAFERVENVPWRGGTLHFEFGPLGRNLALEIDGRRVEGTLQVPEGMLGEGTHTVRLVEAEARTLWIRSRVQLDTVETDGGQTTYSFTAHGPAEISFARKPARAELTDPVGTTVECRWTHCRGIATVRFHLRGKGRLRTAES